MRTSLVSSFGLLVMLGCNTSDRTEQTIQDLDLGDPVALERAATRASGKELAQLEAELDTTLRAGYVGLTDAKDHARAVRTASIEWVRQVRRHLGEPLHTSVAALADDPDCAGSVIGNAVLLDYVDAALGDERRTDRVVAALEGLARQTVCLEQSQSTELAVAMKIAFDDVVTTLRIDQLDGAIPYLAQATSAPMLLVHDIERQHGSDAPLSRWFTEYEAALIDGAKTLHHPAAWHGLWLYDRITGRLRGFRATERSTDENTVELASLFHTIAQPAIDDGRCSLAEMVQRGSYGGRYQCLGAACASGDERACAVPGGTGGTEPAKGSVNVPGFSTTSALSCITAQVDQTSSRQQLTCLIEATGRGASPRDSLTKGLTLTTLAGVKPGGVCDRGANADRADQNYNLRVKRAEERYDEAIADAREAQHEATEELIAAQRDRDAIALEDQRNPTPENDAALAEANQDVKEHAEKVNAAAQAEADAEAKAAEERDKDLEDAKEGYEEDKEAEAGSGAGSGGYCVDSASCGGCSALSAQAQAMLDCVTDDAAPESHDPMNGPGGCGLACDPIDPSTPTSGIGCIEGLANVAGAAISQTCWAVRCGPADQGTGACCGGASANGTPDQITGMCGAVDCGDGVQPTFAGGRCTCGSSGEGLPGGPVVPTSGADLGYPFP